MDASRFDAWTRRRFGLLTGGLAASLIGAISLADVDAKKKKKKKKCRKLTQGCGAKKKCCKGITCGTFPAGKFCCHTVGQSCRNDIEDSDCCEDFVCNEDNVCQSLCPSCRQLDESCGSGCACCAGLDCVDGDCCLADGADCDFSAECCGTLTCQGGTCDQCVPENGACADTSECCGSGPPFLQCVGNLCVPQ